jgi:hypothetical protein
MDWLNKLKGRMGSANAAIDDEMLKRYGEQYGKAGGLQRGLMRIAAQAPEGGEEMDLESTLTPKLGQPTGADPLEIYRKLYSTYGGRKTRGLLFD